MNKQNINKIENLTKMYFLLQFIILTGIPSISTPRLIVVCDFLVYQETTKKIWYTIEYYYRIGSRLSNTVSFIISRSWVDLRSGLDKTAVVWRIPNSRNCFELPINARTNSLPQNLPYKFKINVRNSTTSFTFSLDATGKKVVKIKNYGRIFIDTINNLTNKSITINRNSFFFLSFEKTNSILLTKKGFDWINQINSPYFSVRMNFAVGRWTGKCFYLFKLHVSTRYMRLLADEVTPRLQLSDLQANKIHPQI